MIPSCEHGTAWAARCDACEASDEKYLRRRTRLLVRLQSDLNVMVRMTGDPLSTALAAAESAIRVQLAKENA